MSINVRRQRCVWAGGVVAVIAVIGSSWMFIQHRLPRHAADEKSHPYVTSRNEPIRPEPEFLELTEQAISAMQLKTSPAVVPRFSKMLHLRGSLAIDSNRLSRVHARFPGQIYELATAKGLRSQQAASNNLPVRPLQNFDEVAQGVPLAVIWSKDLGEKKSQLAVSLAKLRVDKQTLENFKALTKSGAISDRELREKRAEVEQGEIAAFTAEATLRAYQVTEDDIKQVIDSAEKIHRSEATEKSYASDWPRVIVTAPIGGTIVDKVVTVGDIVDANDELFKIADLSVLAVWLHPYEEDLPALEQLPKPLQVSIKVLAHPELGELPGQIDRFSPIIDPNEHMALLIGSVKNPHGALLANQFITADVGIPAEKGVVEIPADALIDVGNDAVVYIQTDLAKPQYHRRKVSVMQRYFDVVYVRSELNDEQKKQGLHAIHPGDAVVAGSILELEDYLQQLR